MKINVFQIIKIDNDIVFLDVNAWIDLFWKIEIFWKDLKNIYQNKKNMKNILSIGNLPKILGGKFRKSIKLFLFIIFLSHNIWRQIFNDLKEKVLDENKNF